MPRKPAVPMLPDVPPEVCEVVLNLHMQLRASPNASGGVKKRWCQEARAKVGPYGAQLAQAIFDANIPLYQTINYFGEGSKVDQKQNPGGTNVHQTAGGNMTGVNATGTQIIRDITAYSQDLDQSGAAINSDLKNSLLAARSGLEASDIDAALKPHLMEQFDKMTEELKKGPAKNEAAAKGFWTMVYSVIKGVPGAAACVKAFETLKDMLGY